MRTLCPPATGFGSGRNSAAVDRRTADAGKTFGPETVRSQRFPGSTRPRPGQTDSVRTVGVEEELLLVDPATGRAVAAAGTVLDRDPDPPPTEAGSKPDAASVESELQQQQLETGTPPTTSLEQLEVELRAARLRADELARAAGVRIAALATSPLPVDPEVMPKSRYRAMVDHFGLTAAEQLTCGCHVHVEVESAEEGVAVLDRIRCWLPPLLALSANSPYWQGRDSGYASFRSQAWNRFPGAGPTRRFGSAAAYAEFTDTLVASGVLLDHAMVYFDARLSLRYPTVEVRVADVCLRVEDAVLLAGLVRALVESAAREWRRHVPAADVPTDVVRLASWQASRHGLSGRCSTR